MFRSLAAGLSSNGRFRKGVENVPSVLNVQFFNVLCMNVILISSVRFACQSHVLNLRPRDWVRLRSCAYDSVDVKTVNVFFLMSFEPHQRAYNTGHLR